MLTRLSLFAWLVTLESLDAAPERQRALNSGYEVAALAVGDGLLANDAQARLQIARPLAELEADGWVAWDWTRYAGHPQHEQPPASIFDEDDLRKVANVRITPEGYAAFAARQQLSGAGAIVEPRPYEVASAPEGPRYDLFISHASEDKPAVARPLAAALSALGFAVWYDEEVLEVGASLRRSIDAGLAQSRFGVVVFSRAFFEKEWPARELDGLFARELAEGAEIILPLWHEIDQAFMTTKSPMLAGRFALRTETGIPQIAERLSRRLRRERGDDQLRARTRPIAPPPPSSSAPATGAVPRTNLDAGSSALQTREDTIAMLRADDIIGLKELLLFERRAFDDGVLATLKEAGDELQDVADPERLHPVEERLWQLVERRLGSLLPVLEYRSESLLPEISALADLGGRSPAVRSPYAAWLEGQRWPVWLVTLILGTTAVALDQPGIALALWEQRSTYRSQRPLPAARLGGGAELGQALTRARGASVVGPVELWYPAFATHDSDLLRTHYGEIMRGGEVQDSPLGFLSRAGDFLWLCGALAGRDGLDIIRFWSASQVHPTLPDRLDTHSIIATRLAESLDLDPAELKDTLHSWIEIVQGPTV